MKSQIATLTALTLTAAFAPGCIIIDDDPIDTGYTISASWTVKNVGGAATSCPLGFDTVRLISQSQSGLPTIEDLFDCAALGGITAGFPTGDYIVSAQITNQAVTQTYAESLPVAVSLTRNTAVSFEFINDGGYFLLGWTVGGQPASSGCAAAQAPTVSVLSTVTGGMDGLEDLFDCPEGAAYTAPLLAGSYTVSISALNDANLAVGTAPPLVNQAIGPQTQVTSLGTVDIPLN